MSNLIGSNIVPVEGFTPDKQWIRPMNLVDPTILDPQHTYPLVDGEWLTLATAGGDAGKKVERAATISTLGTASAGGRATQRAWMQWGELGRSDSLSMADPMASVFWLGFWELDVKLFDASAVVASGAAITGILQPLKVATISVGSPARNVIGLVGHGGGGDAAIIQAYVVRLPSTNKGMLRIRNYL